MFLSIIKLATQFRGLRRFFLRFATAGEQKCGYERKSYRFRRSGNVRHFSKITASARQVLFFFAPVGMRLTPGISPASHI
jgi:hypothetical protein